MISLSMVSCIDDAWHDGVLAALKGREYIPLGPARDVWTLGRRIQIAEIITCLTVEGC